MRIITKIIQNAKIYKIIDFINSNKVIRQLQSLPLIREGAHCYLINFAPKRTSNINNPTSDEQFDYTKTMKIEKKTERYDNFLHITSDNHPETGTNSKMVIDRQSQKPTILLINFHAKNKRWIS